MESSLQRKQKIPVTNKDHEKTKLHLAEQNVSVKHILTKTKRILLKTKEAKVNMTC